MTLSKFLLHPTSSVLHQPCMVGVLRSGGPAWWGVGLVRGKGWNSDWGGTSVNPHLLKVSPLPPLPFSAGVVRLR